MPFLFETAWLTILGLSLIFVGGFVLWVYGAQEPHKALDIAGPEAQATREVHAHLVQWYFLYGIVTVLFGVGCLVGVAALVF